MSTSHDGDVPPAFSAHRRGKRDSPHLSTQRTAHGRVFRGMLLASFVVASLSLTSCSPADTHVTSPIGTWRALPDDTGTLTFDDDGTFAFTDASFDPISSRDDAGGYDGGGRWELSGSNANVYLIFTSTPQDPTSTGTHLSVTFASGQIDFHDAEETVGIEFKLDR